MVAINSTWYRPPSLETRLSKDQIESREYDYHSWWEEKWGKLWRDRQEAEIPASDVLRSPLLKSLRVIGTKENMPITINAVTHAMGDWDMKDGVIVSINKSAPNFYVVSHGGNRLDSFLKLANAKAFAEKYLAAE